MPLAVCFLVVNRDPTPLPGQGCWPVPVLTQCVMPHTERLGPGRGVPFNGRRSGNHDDAEFYIQNTGRSKIFMSSHGTSSPSSLVLTYCSLPSFLRVTAAAQPEKIVDLLVIVEAPSRNMSMPLPPHSAWQWQWQWAWPLMSDDGRAPGLSTCCKGASNGH